MTSAECGAARKEGSAWSRALEPSSGSSHHTFSHASSAAAARPVKLRLPRVTSTPSTGVSMTPGANGMRAF